ncbi:MAG: imidazole glycerol phosphate synthase subunit HisF [Actinobacteria bacterium]|nr:imidazole glycerol phosphate synthase subunit HisF [Actinomycetota bacterium]
MSLAVRIIPCLDVENKRVVKGVNFKDLKDAGDPVELASLYSKNGADEITFLDISASKNNEKTILEVIKLTAEEVFIPLTVGGGIRSIEDVDQLLRAGADKVSINTSAISNPNLISEISNQFGSQVLVISIDARRSTESHAKSGFEVTTHGGTKSANLDAFSWIKESIDRGCGEILLNSMDKDGTKDGFDLELIEKVKEISSVPIIASGGAGKVKDFVEAAKKGADALLAASVFHFREVEIRDVKSELKISGFEVRD